MEIQSWFCTLITQLTLCVVLYIALNIGQPQKPLYRHGNEGGTNDLYFISVRGGFRPLKQQSHLLNQVEKVAKAYKVEFVFNISELGEDDPLLQNEYTAPCIIAFPCIVYDFNYKKNVTDLLQQATWYLPSLKVPWYTTRVQKEHATGYFVKWIKISHGNTLAVVALNTGSLQDVSGGSENIQLRWLSRTLEASNSIWHIAVGFHPLVNCGQNLQRMEAKENIDPLYHMLLKYGVNAYLSGQPCLNDDVPQRGMSHISSNSNSKVAGPYFTPMTRQSLPYKELVNGFLLHRVSALEIVTYAVTVEGDIVNRSSVHQRGREVM